MTCNQCGTQFEGKFCPNCGTAAATPVTTPVKQKKPIYKKWWFWVIAVLLVIGVAGGSGEETDSPNDKDLGNSVAQSTGAIEETGSAAEETVDTTEAPVADNVTTSQKQALRKAASYLDVSAFSYNGLIEQLEFEQFSHEDAVYAADHCGANWNEQALEKAKSYLDVSAFSYSGLIDQLEYEEFTTEQATYAVDNCGADWNEQAVQKAKDYLDVSAFSRDSLIDQLEYEGFTHEQAVYGVEANGF